MPYRITQCYLPPDRGDIPAFTPLVATGCIAAVVSRITFSMLSMSTAVKSGLWTCRSMPTKCPIQWGILADTQHVAHGTSGSHVSTFPDQPFCSARTGDRQTDTHKRTHRDKQTTLHV